MKPFRIRIFSDLHMGPNVSYKPIFKEPANAVALLGDIAPPLSLTYKHLLESLSETHDYVFVVFGNHEYYSASHHMDEIEDKFKLIIANMPKVHFLQNDEFIVRHDNRDIRILGTTLWSRLQPSKIPLIRDRLNDYYQIKKINKNLDNPRKIIPIEPEDTMRLHEFAVRWLFYKITGNAPGIAYEKPCDLRTVVLTHHCPLDMEEVSQQYYLSDINSAFCTDLSALMRAPVYAWCYGHLHVNANFDFKKDEHVVKICTNQKGYTTERIGFNPDYVLIV